MAQALRSNSLLGPRAPRMILQVPTILAGQGILDYTINYQLTQDAEEFKSVYVQLYR
jgi:hypothetical protein